MKRLIGVIRFLAVAACAVLFVGCEDNNDKELPDLVPAKAPAVSGQPEILQQAYYTYTGGKINVFIRNQGDAAAAATTVAIHYYKVGNVPAHIEGSVQALAKGEMAIVSFSIPSDHGSSDFFFTIEVDYGDAVEESDETNNDSVDQILVG